MNLKVLYLFAGSRRKQYEEYKKGNAPDMYLVGLNHMAGNSIDATFFENRLTEFLRKISFNMVQLPVIFRLTSYDVIFSGSGLLTLFIVKYLLRFKKPKWVVYNTYLSNLLKRNPSGLKGWIIRKAVFSADAIVSPSLAQCDFLKSIGFPSQKNYYVPYGVDYNFYNKNTDTGIEVPELSGRYILSAGRDVGRDFKTLIEAVKDSPIKLCIFTFPRNLINIGELPPNVTVLFFEAAKMPGLLKGAEFVVIPTIPEVKMAGSDCSGQYNLLGAMSRGKAVITSARATLADYFTSGQHGIIVTPQSVDELREAIISLWNDPQKTKIMGEAARQQVKDRFTMEIFSEKLAAIFKEIAARQ